MGTINENALVKLPQLNTAVTAIAAQVKANYVAKGDTSYENVIDIVKVNGTALTVDENKAVDITVPTAVSDLTNDLNFQTDAEVEALLASTISSAYKAAGTIAAAGIDSAKLVAANEGKVYNVSEAFSATSALFVDYVAGNSYPAGTNIVVVEATPADDSDPENPVAATYKFDVLAGFVDLGTYLQTTDLVEGDNITITPAASGNGRTISAVDTTYTAGTGIEIDDTSNNAIGLDSATQASLAAADSALQVTDIVEDDGSITLTKTGNTIEIAANVKPDDNTVGSEFTNLLKVDGTDGSLYVDASEVQGTLAGTDNNGIETSVTAGVVEAELHVTDKADNLFQVVAADAQNNTVAGAYVSGTAVKGLFSGTDTNSIDVTYSNGDISADAKISNVSGNLLTTLSETSGEGAHTAGLAVVLEFATDQEVTAIVEAAFADDSGSGD